MSIFIAEKHYSPEFAEAAKHFRNIAFEVEANPDVIMQHQDSLAAKLLLQDDSKDIIYKTKLYEALAYGDAACIFASPRPCLSGLLLADIGSEDQYQCFHESVRQHKLRTCFAVTEPDFGSDAGNMAAQLLKKENENYEANGHKWLFGNGVCADIGVFFARSCKGPLGIQAALIDISSVKTEENFQAELLPMIGLKAARLSSVIFKNFPIKKDNLIGMQVSPTRRGLFALLKTFNKMRICIAAMAIGHAQALIDYIEYERKNLTQLEKSKLNDYKSKVEALRYLVFQVAEKLTAEKEATTESSFVKVSATQLIEAFSRDAFDYFGQGSLIEHPLLAKSYRDAFAYEFADGTSHVQRNQIYQGYARGIFN